MGTQRKASGFVLVRETPDGVRYLLLESRKWAEAGLPKGHVEAGESEIETARRETLEETGLLVEAPLPGFRRAIGYPVVHKGKTKEKEAVYRIAWAPGGEVVLSDEHTESAWASLGEALERLPHLNLVEVVRAAALHLKDPALFDLAPKAEGDARRHLEGLPEIDPVLLGHVSGAARLARAFAEALARGGARIDVEATATGAMLHDVGRALGRHRDHQAAGVDHIRETDLAAYGFACISHFTKGAPPPELLGAGLEPGSVEAFEARIALTPLTWEERCVALADSCMDLDRPVPPRVRFRGLRKRYDAPAFIALQERRTDQLRAVLGEALGADPLALVGLLT